jgi:hypothetical protein
MIISQLVCCGRAIGQAVNRPLPTAATQVRTQVRSCGICDGQSGAGASFLQVLRFPLPILIPPTAPHLSSIIRGWYNRPVSGRRSKWTQSHLTPRNKNESVTGKDLALNPEVRRTSLRMNMHCFQAERLFSWETSSCLFSRSRCFFVSFKRQSSVREPNKASICYVLEGLKASRADRGGW